MDVLLKDSSNPLFWYSIILLAIGMSFIATLDIMKSSFEKQEYYTWIIIAHLLPFLGPILYLFIGRKRKLK